MKSPRTLPLWAALGFALVLPSPGWAQAYTVTAVRGGGSITGSVTYAAGAVTRSEVPVTMDQEICGQTTKYSNDLIVNSTSGGIQNVVVSISGISSGKDWNLPEGGVVLDQHGCSFDPHVLVVPVGQSLNVLNNDGLMHNIHTHAEINRSVNKAQPKLLKKLTLKFKKSEFVGVTCDVHKWMKAWIVVAEHPYHAVTDENGAFQIDNVPPGSYTLEFWHEELGQQSRPIEIAPGQAAQADLAFAESE